MESVTLTLEDEMNKTIQITALLLLAVGAVTAQTPNPLADLPPLNPAGPVHEVLPSLLKGPSEPEVITPANRRFWEADFEIHMRHTMSAASNLSVNVVLHRKYKLENLQSVDLVIGPTGETRQMPLMHCAKLFVPFWRRQMFDDQNKQDAAVYRSFVLSRELAKEAFLRLECFRRFDTNARSSRIVKGPTSVYLINLNSFVPDTPAQPPRRRQAEPHESGDDTNDTINIEIKI
jgi:hypothetical protein